MTDTRGWARGFATGLSSLRDRAAARLAALRFNPSRKYVGRAMFYMPFVAVFAGELLYLGFLPTIVIFGGAAVLIAWFRVAAELS